VSITPSGVSFVHRPLGVALVLVSAIGALTAVRASAQLAVSANDNKAVLVDGVNTVVRNPPPDTVTILDLSVSPARVVGELRMPTSIIGPPTSVAIAPDRSLALVTASMRIDPADPTKTVPDTTVSVIDLASPTPVVLATLQAGPGASGVAINPAGTLALVANRTNGTVSVFAIAGKRVTPAGTVDLGAPDAWPSGVVFTRDGRRALVTRNNDSLVSVLSVDGARVVNTKTDFAAGPKPYGIEITPAGDLAVIAHIAASAGPGTDALTLVDLTASTPRVVAEVTAGPTIEGVTISPDGRHVAATVMNGSNLPKASPFFHEAGLLRIFAFGNRTLVPVAEVPAGRWCQGIAWAGDGRRLFVQCAADRELRIFDFDGRTLQAAGAIKMSGAPVGIATRR
jgi:DNA-binding beta-propeller fold protein YncE